VPGVAAEAGVELWCRWYAEDELDDLAAALDEPAVDELWVALVVSGTPGIAAEGPVWGWLADLAWLPLLPLAAVPAPVLLAAGAGEFADPASAGTPGMATPGAGERGADDAPVAGDEPDPPELDEPVEAAETPGMAAIASATWVAACGVAWVAPPLCCLVADAGADFAAGWLDPLLRAAVVDAGRLPLSTKP